jgi:Carboxypeptidase regulatory-like domain/TonB dependent receptor
MDLTGFRPNSAHRCSTFFSIRSKAVSESVRTALARARVLAVGLVAIAIITAAAPATAQVLYGSIVGSVTDSQGAIVPGVTVTITSKETNLTREATTSAEGTYSLGNVLPGTYDVKAALQGFREIIRQNVPVTVGQVSRVDVVLEVGALTETVTVQSRSELMQTDTADVHTELRSTEIAALPTNQFRNYQALVTLTPGSTPMQFQNAETDTPARSLATNVNGQAINSNATRTDGATNVNIWLPSHNMYVSPAETVDTVNISTNNFDAEQGMAGGSAITVVTKSGTNQLKGSAFEFHNNESLNAKPYFFGTGPAPDKLPISRNIFGGTVGGPIAKDKVFFFGSYEGYKSTATLFTFFNVPDERLRRGDFSGATNANGSLQVIYNPNTGAANGTGRTPFPNNQIPTGQLNQISLDIMNRLLPLPNIQGTGPGGLTGNYQREETRTTDRHNYDAKINWNRTSSHQIWGKFSYMDAVVDDLTNYMGPPVNAENDGGFTKVWQFTMGQTWTVSPTVLFDATFGFSRQDQDVLGPDFDSGFFGLDTLGIPGTNDPTAARDQRYAGYPQFDVGFGGTSLAPTAGIGNRDGWNPIFRDERTYSVAANMTKVAGKHEFRGGYLVNFLYLDHWQPESGNPRGRFDFTTRGTTALRGGTQAANFYNYWAAFMLGLPGTVSKSVQNELMTGREWQHGLFFRDRWAVSPKLTLDLGIRWEYYPIMKRADRGLERIDLDTLEVILGGLGGNPDDVGLEASWGNFAPRLGAIYRWDDNTVVRGGYGVTYNPIPWSRALRGDQAYPITIPFSFFNNDTFVPYGSINQGLPIVTGPDTSTGRVALPNSVTVATPEVGNIDRGTIQTWNLAFERRLPWDVSLDLAYVGARGDGGYAQLDINNPLTIGSGNAGRPYASRGRTTQLLSFGQRLKTRYNSLQVALNRPFTRGILLKGAYTLSRAKNNASGGGADQDGRVTLNWNLPGEFERNYAVAGFDRTHVFQMGFLYQLPWQSGGNTGIARAIINDWQVNGVLGAFTGLPFTTTANADTLNTPNNTQTADLVGEPNKLGNIGAEGTYYDISAWAQPQGVRFGNTGRNQFRGPGGWNVDLSVFRAFPIGASRRLEFRLETANLFNTAKFANPNGDFTSSNFMRITAIANSNGVPHYPERQIRLGLRFSF